ncbi:NAD(P)-binding protein [Sparassis latifolia]
MEQVNKVWLITGTSSGFGKRLVASVLARGDRVIATVRNLKNAPIPLDSQRSRLHVLVLDVASSADKIQRTVEAALAVWGRIDVLVNNAGTGAKGMLEEVSPSTALAQFQTNVFGVMNVTNATLPHMRSRRSGTVVIIGSRSVWKTGPTVGMYVASKAAVHALGETYAAELRPLGVRVMVVAPGAFRTENIHSAPITAERRIPAYDGTRAAMQAVFRDVAVNAPGDPAKAMELLVDVVKGEGAARGHEMPLYLMLGGVTFSDVRVHQKKVSACLDGWEGVASDLNFDAPL